MGASFLCGHVVCNASSRRMKISLHVFIQQTGKMEAISGGGVREGRGEKRGTGREGEERERIPTQTWVRGGGEGRF